MTVLEKINIAKVSQYLAVDRIHKGGLFGGGIDLNWPRKLYTVRKNVEWMYNLDPSDSTLETTSNYLYALCGDLALEAAYILSISGGGSVVPPSPPSTSTIYPIHITSSDFTGTAYDNSDIVGDTLMLFINQLSQTWWFAGVDSFEYTATGINILIPGFDPSLYDYDVIIQKVRNL